MASLEINNKWNDLLSILKCCLSTDNNSHIAEDPIYLSCGHWTCRGCIVPGTMYKPMKCNTCHQINCTVSQQPLGTISFKTILSQSMNTVFENLYQEFIDKIKRSETAFTDLKEIFELKIEFIRDNIMLRVESLKIELEKLEEKLNYELNQVKMNWKSGFEKNVGVEFNKDEYYKDLDEIESLIRRNEDLNEANLYKFQNRIKALNEYIKSSRDLAPEIRFIESKDKLNEDLIGLILVGDVIERMKTNKYDTINIVNCKPFDVCILPNDNTLICNYGHSNLLLLNRRNELIRTITTIGSQSLKIISACSNDVDAVYLSNRYYNTIIKTDLNFNTQLASFGTYNQDGTDNDHLHHPQGICFSNNSIYVCDNFNKRIQILNQDLVYQQSFKLNYTPWYIKLLNNVACVRMNGVNIISFYDLKTFKVLKRYEHNGLIGVCEWGFIEYNAKNTSFYCYDKNGELLEQIGTTTDFELSSNTFGGIVVNGRSNKLILCQCNSSNLFLI